MDANISKMLGIGMAILLFVIVAAVALGFVDFGQGMASDANEELVRFNDQLTRSKNRQRNHQRPKENPCRALVYRYLRFKDVVPPGIEPGTPGFSVLCSTI